MRSQADTTYEQRESWIFTPLIPFFAKAEFTYLPALKQFRKDMPNGFQNVVISISHYENSSVVEAHLGIRLESVEQMAFQFTMGLTGFQQDSHTLITSIGRLKDKKYERYSVAQAEEAQRATSAIQTYMQQHGFEFLNNYSSANALDCLFNEQPDEPLSLVYNNFNRCLRGVVLAHLTHRENFEELVQTYLHELRATATPQQLQDRFIRLVQFLSSYSPN